MSSGQRGKVRKNGGGLTKTVLLRNRETKRRRLDFI